MECSKAGKKNGGRKLNENHKGGMERRRRGGVVVGNRNEKRCEILLER